MPDALLIFICLSFLGQTSYYQHAMPTTINHRNFSLLVMTLQFLMSDICLDLNLKNKFIKFPKRF